MRLYHILCFCTILTTTSAQTFDDIIESNRYIDCRDVTFNATSIIAQLYSRHQIDSIYQFLDYWEGKCGSIESIFRLRNILDIQTGQFQPDSISPLWIERLIAYKKNLEYRNYYFYSPLGMPPDLISRQVKFDSLTQDIAIGTSSPNIDGSLILDFYAAENPTFQKIRSAPEESRLKALYRNSYEQAVRIPQFHIAVMTGLALNYGNISIFGTRPSFGMVMGAKQLRHNYDVVLDFRAGPSKENYSFVYQDSLITGNTWTGVYVGFEYTFDFVHKPKLDIGVSPAIGYDRITALTTENEYGEDSKGLSSFNKNIGLVVKYKFGKSGGYLGMHLRYNWVNYKNPGGTLLDGEYVSVRLTIGSIAEFWRDSRLNDLR